MFCCNPCILHAGFIVTRLLYNSKAMHYIQTTNYNSCFQNILSAQNVFYSSHMIHNLVKNQQHMLFFSTLGRGIWWRRCKISIQPSKAYMFIHLLVILEPNFTIPVSNHTLGQHHLPTIFQRWSYVICPDSERWHNVILQDRASTLGQSFIWHSPNSKLWP